MNITISKIGRTLIWLLLVATLILGIGFRFSSLEQKVYWFDETFTSLRTAGFKNKDVSQLFANSRQIRVSELQRSFGLSSSFVVYCHWIQSSLLTSLGTFQEVGNNLRFAVVAASVTGFSPLPRNYLKYASCHQGQSSLKPLAYKF